MDMDFESVVKKNQDIVNSSDLFVAIYSDGYKKDGICALQLGMAIIAEKPIVLMVKKGTVVPDSLKSIAMLVETIDSDNMEGMAKKLSDKITKMVDDSKSKNFRHHHADIISKFIVSKMLSSNHSLVDKKNYSISEDTFKRTVDGSITLLSGGNVLALSFKVQGEEFINELSEQLQKGM